MGTVHARVRGPRGGWAGLAGLGQGRQRGCGSCFGPEAGCRGREGLGDFYLPKVIQRNFLR